MVCGGEGREGGLSLEKLNKYGGSEKHCINKKTILVAVRQENSFTPQAATLNRIQDIDKLSPKDKELVFEFPKPKAPSLQPYNKPIVCLTGKKPPKRNQARKRKTNWVLKTPSSIISMPARRRKSPGPKRNRQFPKNPIKGCRITGEKKSNTGTVF